MTIYKYKALLLRVSKKMKNNNNVFHTKMHCNNQNVWNSNFFSYFLFCRTVKSYLYDFVCRNFLRHG